MPFARDESAFAYQRQDLIIHARTNIVTTDENSKKTKLFVYSPDNMFLVLSRSVELLFNGSQYFRGNEAFFSAPQHNFLLPELNQRILLCSYPSSGAFFAGVVPKL